VRPAFLEQQPLLYDWAMSDPTGNPIFKLSDQITRANADIRHIADFLKAIPPSVEGQKARVRAERAIKRLEQAMHTLSMNPASLLGSIGGRKTAERGPEYFRRIAGMRKTRAGGRPKKQGEDQA
jgi:plasmid stabilization system protein ParE